MAQYKSFIDTIYTTINDKSKTDIDKSNIIIDGIQKIMKPKPDINSNINSESPDLTKVSCSSFSNSVVQFICKLDKNKDKLCNLPTAVTWVIGKDKINAIISFITTNKSFVETVWQRFQSDDDKKQLNNLFKNLQTKISSQSPSCINNIQTFLDNLRQLSASSLLRPSSIASTASMSDLTSVDTTSRPSSFASSRPSSIGSVDSDISSLSSTSNRSDSSDSSKRYGQRFSSSPVLPVITTPIIRELTKEEKEPENMYIDNSSSLSDYEKNPANMWTGGVRKSRKFKKSIRKLRKNKKNKYTKRNNKRNNKRYNKK